MIVCRPRNRNAQKILIVVDRLDYSGENEKENAILQPFAVYRIDVNKDDEALMASYHSKARYSVRASIKSEATCRLGNRDDIPEFCRLLADTAKRDGFSARGEKYFYDMYDLLGEDMVKIFMVECEGRAIAGSVLIACAGKSWHMYAGSSEEFKETMPNFLMQWEMMRWSRDNGYYLYDMRGIAGGADIVLIPEIPYDLDVIADAIKKRTKAGKHFTIIAVAEGAISKEDAKMQSSYLDYLEKYAKSQKQST